MRRSDARQSDATKQREGGHARARGRIRGRLLIDITRTHTREFVVMPPRATKKTKTNASGDGGGSRGAHAGKAVDYGTDEDDEEDDDDEDDEDDEDGSDDTDEITVRSR